MIEVNFVADLNAIKRRAQRLNSIGKFGTGNRRSRLRKISTVKDLPASGLQKTRQRIDIGRRHLPRSTAFSIRRPSSFVNGIAPNAEKARSNQFEKSNGVSILLGKERVSHLAFLIAKPSESRSDNTRNR